MSGMDGRELPFFAMDIASFFRKMSIKVNRLADIVLMAQVGHETFLRAGGGDFKVQIRPTNYVIKTKGAMSLKGSLCWHVIRDLPTDRSG